MQDEEIDQQLETMDAEVQRRMEKLMAMADQELAKLLLKRVLATLISNIDTGLATASDLNVARALLKDNNIGIVPTRDNAAGILEARLKQQEQRALSTPGITAPNQLNEVDISDFVQRVN